eukprot:3936432-Amphidinium_carterae.1
MMLSGDTERRLSPFGTAVAAMTLADELICEWDPFSEQPLLASSLGIQSTRTTMKRSHETSGFGVDAHMHEDVHSQVDNYGIACG